jgi:hypothetical protein
MGYHTDFNGSFTLNKPLTIAQRNFLQEFATTRHMNRDVTKIESLPDHEKNHKMLKLLKELGLGLEYYSGSGEYGQGRDASILGFNSPPAGQPGLWCQWVPSEDGTEIEWDGGEKFYNYVEWIEYIVKHFIAPWGLTLNGEVEWQGEERDDRGLIVIKDNKITTKKAKVTWE